VHQLAQLVQQQLVEVAVGREVRLEAPPQRSPHAELLGHDERLEHHADRNVQVVVAAQPRAQQT